jgi:hypothetical protein
VEGLFVLLDFAFGAAHADVPMTGAGDDHLADQEEVAGEVEGVNGAGRADRVRLLCVRLSLNRPPLFRSLPLESLWAGCIIINMNMVQEAGRYR